MMRESFFGAWGIQQRALFLALAPMVIVSLIVTYYLTTSHISTAESSLQQRGNGIVKTLAKSAEFGITVGDSDLLLGLIEASMVDQDVIAVTITTSSGERLASKTREGWTVGINHPELIPFSELVFSAPAPDAELEEFASPSEDELTQPVGRVDVSISRKSLDKKQSNIFYNSVTLVAAIAILSIALAAWFVRSLIAPVKKVINAVEDLGDGKLHRRVPEVSEGEMGKLEKGINQMAETIEQSQDNLKKEVESATNKLGKNLHTLQQQNTELAKAREAALLASEAKASFLAQISHELRTPLNAIIGFSRLSLRQGSGTAQLEYLKIINQAGDQLLTVINDVLNFSKIESGKMVIHNDFFNPHEKLEEVVGLLSHEAHRKNLELVLLIHSDVPQAMYSDANRFAQIIINLLNNAVKFTETGQVTVIAETLSKSSGVPHLKISVVDSGIGISPSIKAQLFTPFSQGDNSITKHFSGTGLGLTISKALTESMGGEIQWENNRKSGTTFSFTLPGISFFGGNCLHDSSVLRADKALIVDSNAMSRRSIRNTLISYGVEVFQNPDRQQIPSLLAAAASDNSPYTMVIIGACKKEADELDYPELNDLAERKKIGMVILIGDEETAQEMQTEHQSQRLRIGLKPSTRRSLNELICKSLDRDDIKPLHRQALPNDVEIIHKFSALIGDDNLFGQQLLTQFLEQLGGTVTAVSDGIAFVEAAKESRYDLMFIDIHMPKLDGISAAQQLAGCQNKNTHTPIIAVTADVFFELGDCTPSDTHHFQSVIHKPVTTAALEKVIRENLEPHAAAAPNKQIQPPTQHDQPRYPDGLQVELQRQITALEDAALKLNRGALKDHAHQLNGLTDFFSLPDFKQAGRELESSAMDAEPEAIKTLIQRIQETAASINWNPSDK